MNNLVIMKDQQAVTSSLQVAESFGKQHKNVIQIIEDKLNTAENSALLKMFSEGTYKASNGKQNKMYYMNRDGFTFIAMGFTGAKADGFKLKYIEAFNQLEEEHKQNQIDVNELSPGLKMFNQIFHTVAASELENKKLNHKVDNIAEIVSLNTTDWRKTSQSIVRKIAKAQGEYDAYRDVPNLIYEETDRRAGSNLKVRLTNLKKNRLSNGMSRSKVDKTNKLDVIDGDKRLKEIYMAVVRTLLSKIRFGRTNTDDFRDALKNKVVSEMSQTIKAEIVMEIPPDQVVISKAEFNEYQSLKDEGRWWNSADIYERYHHRMDWMKENILTPFKSELDSKNGGCVHYADPDNGKFWSFEPKRFKKFMEDNFSKINK